MLATEDDLAFCRAYGHVSHDFYGDLGWFIASKEMQVHWIGARGERPLDWGEAKDYVREGWNIDKSRTESLTACFPLPN